MNEKIFYAGSECFGFYILHQDGSVSDNNGFFYRSFSEADFYSGLGDMILPKFKD